MSCAEYPTICSGPSAARTADTRSGEPPPRWTPSMSSSSANSTACPGRRFRTRRRSRAASEAESRTRSRTRATRWPSLWSLQPGSRTWSSRNPAGIALSRTDKNRSSPTRCTSEMSMSGERFTRLTARASPVLAVVASGLPGPRTPSLPPWELLAAERTDRGVLWREAQWTPPRW